VSANRLVAGLIALLLPIGLTDCGRAVTASGLVQRAMSAPEGSYAVGVRTLTLGSGTARPLPVTVWYPAEQQPSAGAAGAAGTPIPAPQQDAPIATGRFPLVLFSHGLYSLPELHTQLTARWAAAGFVVAAPAYPHTSRRATRFSRDDIRNQPDDGWRVIRQVLRLGAVHGDPFAGHLDPDRIAAAGHSAGGYTTAGLFISGHPERLRAGIVIAGAGMPGASFAGPPAALLFIHGGADPTVPTARARAAYDQLQWPKAFLTLTGQGHGEYLTPGRAGFDQTVASTTDFLRWTLYQDAAARQRISADAQSPGVTEFVNRL
jgi:dienelactone hydrolase